MNSLTKLLCKFFINSAFVVISVCSSYPKFANDMNEVHKFCVEQTFLNKYYKKLNIKKEIKDNDFQMMNAKLQKMLIEDFYSQIDEGYMREILKCEGDRKIIEIVLNTMESEIKGNVRKQLFPKVTSIDMGMCTKLSECMSIDELRSIINSHHRLRKIVGFDDDKIIGMLINLEVDCYYSSFSVYNDISCVYAYFKLKEQEIKNIIWIVECISMNKKNFVKDMILPKTTVE
ncbi:H(+)-transporting V0 sector ATPase subunit d [Binucleata daphniae]